MPNPSLRSNATEQIITGHFNSASDVLHADLRPLEDQEQAQTLKLQKLRAAIQAGEASGPGVDAKQVFDQLKSKYKLASNALDAQHSGSLQSPLALTPALSRKERE